MSQEYVEEKSVSLKKVTRVRAIVSACWAALGVLVLLTLLALISFEPSDPSWSQSALSWQTPIQNWGGKVGAWIADTLFFSFGLIAYALPIIGFALCWEKVFSKNDNDYVDYFSLTIRVLGGIAFVFSACGLAALNIDDLNYFASGGILGSLVSMAMVTWLNTIGATLVLLALWAVGLTLLTGWSWLSIAEKLGGLLFAMAGFFSNKARAEKALARQAAKAQQQEEYLEEEPVKTLELPPVFAHGDEDDVLFSAHSVLDPVEQTEIAAVVAATNPYSIDETQGAAPVIGIESENHALVDDPLFSAVSAIPAVSNQQDIIPTHQDGMLTQHGSVSVADAEDVGSYIEEGLEALTPNTLMQEVINNDDVPLTEVMAKADDNNHVFDSQKLQSVIGDEDIVLPPLVTVEEEDELPPLYHFGDEKTEEVESAPVEPVKTPISSSQSIFGMAAAAGVLGANGAKASDALLGGASKGVNETVNVAQSAGIGASAAAGTVATSSAAQSGSIFAQASAAGLTVPTLMGGKQTTSLAGNGYSSTTQLKQGEGPELPRPNPVRLPTKREMTAAKLGIKLPSQQMAEERMAARQAQQAQQQAPSTPMTAEEQRLEDLRLQEELREAFLAQQAQRYGLDEADDFSPLDSDNATVEMDDDERLRKMLAAQFAEREEARYGKDVLNDTQSVATQPTVTQHAAATAARPEMDNALIITPSENSAFISTAPVTPQATAEQAVTTEPVHSSFEPVSHVATPIVKPEEVALVEQAQDIENSAMDSLLHPFLMRNEQPLEKPTTPLPTLDLLTEPPSESEPIDHQLLQDTARLVEMRLADYRIKADVVGVSPGPVITRYELDLAPGVKAARISNLSTDLARSLSAVAVRVVEVIPGKPYVGLELPNKKRQTVYLREVLDCDKFRDMKSPLATVLGKDIAGEPVVADLGKMPHLLVAGTTGSGKSVGVNAMILSILYKATPDEVRFIMIDPKMLELSVYEGIPHLLTEVVTDMKDAANALRWCVNEMERRYKLMSALGVRNLAGYNERIDQAAAMGRPIPDPFWKPTNSMDMSPPTLERLPYIVVMVDEFADLMMSVGKKVEELIARLAQKARAAGIHLVLATQRPSVDVITGIIKANIPTRIAFTVSSKIDSRTILDQGGAESLLGMGDMLYLAPNTSMPIRVHGAFVRDEEVHAVVNDWKARGRPNYVDGITASTEGEGTAGAEGDEELDPLFDQAVAFVVDKRRASISGVQRQFRIGYNRAARIIEQMEAQGIVSEPAHNGNREVLAPPSNH